MNYMGKAEFLLGAQVLLLIIKSAFPHMSHVMRKHIFRVSNQVQLRPDCTATEDG